jgi:ribosomal protein S18 acetylase RimI-like enzyme
MDVRRATLADVAAVARLTVTANREAQRDLPALHDVEELSSPELALRLLDDLDDGNLLYVAEHEAKIVGFALVTGLMVGDGGHIVELRQLYVMPEQRQRGAGRQLLALVRHELAQRPNPPALRAWAAAGSAAAGFLELAEGAASRPRWKVGPGGIAIRGVVYAWTVCQADAVRRRALAK